MTAMTNDTHCDPCLDNPFPLYPLFQILPTLFNIPIKCFLFWTVSSTKLTEKTDVLTLGVLFVDFLLSVFSVLLALSLVCGSVLYSFFWSFQTGVLSMGHPLFHALVCVERYLAVERPVVFLKYRPLRYRVAVLALASILTLAVQANIFGVCSTDPLLLDIYLLYECAFLVAILSVNTFSCLSILQALVRPPPGDKNGKKDANSIKRIAFYFTSGVQLNLLVVYLPPIVLFAFGARKQRKRFCSIYLFNVCYILTVSSLHALWFLRKTRTLRQRAKK